MQKEKREYDSATLIVIQNMITLNKCEPRTRLLHLCIVRKNVWRKFIYLYFWIGCSKENYKNFITCSQQFTRYGDEIEYPKGVALTIIFANVNFNSRKVKCREKYEENARKATSFFTSKCSDFWHSPFFILLSINLRV